MAGGLELRCPFMDKKLNRLTLTQLHGKMTSYERRKEQDFGVKAADLFSDKCVSFCIPLSEDRDQEL